MEPSGRLEGQRQIALAQLIIDQSGELLDSEDADLIQRGLLLNVQAIDAGSNGSNRSGI